MKKIEELTTLEKLPADVLTHIQQYLGSNKDLHATIGSLNKKCNETVKSFLIQHKEFRNQRKSVVQRLFNPTEGFIFNTQPFENHILIRPTNSTLMLHNVKTKESFHYINNSWNFWASFIKILPINEKYFAFLNEKLILIFSPKLSLLSFDKPLGQLNSMRTRVHKPFTVKSRIKLATYYSGYIIYYTHFCKFKLFALQDTSDTKSAIKHKQLTELLNKISNQDRFTIKEIYGDSSKKLLFTINSQGTLSIWSLFISQEPIDTFNIMDDIQARALTSVKIIKLPKTKHIYAIIAPFTVLLFSFEYPEKINNLQVLKKIDTYCPYGKMHISQDGDLYFITDTGLQKIELDLSKLESKKTNPIRILKSKKFDSGYCIAGKGVYRSYNGRIFKNNTPPKIDIKNNNEVYNITSLQDNYTALLYKNQNGHVCITIANKVAQPTKQIYQGSVNERSIKYSYHKNTHNIQFIRTSSQQLCEIYYITFDFNGINTRGQKHPKIRIQKGSSSNVYFYRPYNQNDYSILSEPDLSKNDFNAYIIIFNKERKAIKFIRGNNSEMYYMKNIFGNGYDTFIMPIPKTTSSIKTGDGFLFAYNKNEKRLQYINLASLNLSDIQFSPQDLFHEEDRIPPSIKKTILDIICKDPEKITMTLIGQNILINKGGNQTPTINYFYNHKAQSLRKYEHITTYLYKPPYLLFQEPWKVTVTNLENHNDLFEFPYRNTIFDFIIPRPGSINLLTKESIDWLNFQTWSDTFEDKLEPTKYLVEYKNERKRTHPGGGPQGFPLKRCRQ